MTLKILSNQQCYSTERHVDAHILFNNFRPEIFNESDQTEVKFKKHVVFVTLF